jgi:transposase-like protein
MRDARTVVERRRRSQAEAESLVRDFEQSGLSRKAFSSAHGIALHTLDYYRARHRSRRATPAVQELLPVDLINASLVSGCLRVELANGRGIVVEAGFDVAVLKRLIAALEG